MAIEIKINDVLVHTITDAEITILKDKFPSGTAAAQITARMIAGINREVTTIKTALIREWYPKKLAENGETTASTDEDTLITTIFAQTGELTHVYRDRDARDLVE